MPTKVKFMCDYTSGRDYLMSLVNTDDRGLIGRVVAGDDEVAKAYVVDNPRLTDEQMMTLANDDYIVVRQELAKASHLSPDALYRLRTNTAESVRVNALCNPLTDYAVYATSVLTNHFSVASKRFFCSDIRAVGSLEVFEYLWRNVKNAGPSLIDNLNHAVRIGSPLIDSRIFDLINDEISSGKASNAVREAYAGSDGVVSPEILDGLKDDPFRPVINAIARNSSALVSTHEYLIDNHKSSGIRSSIAMVTGDSYLLNKIYLGTKSKDIRYWVESNPMFLSE